MSALTRSRSKRACSSTRSTISDSEVTKTKRRTSSPTVVLSPIKQEAHNRSRHKQDRGEVSSGYGVSSQTETSDEDFSDSSDDDVENKMAKVKAHRDRIMESKQELIKKLAIVEMTSEVSQVIAQEKALYYKSRPGPAIAKKNKVLPKRKSLRLQRLDPRGVELPPEPEEETFEEKRKPGIQFPMEANGFDSESVDTENMPPEKSEIMKRRVEDCCAFMDRLRRSNQSFVPPEELLTFDDQPSLKSLKISPDKVRKVVKSRIFSLAIHPSEDQILVAAGDKEGNLGLWNSTKNDSNFGTYQFSPHIKPISCIKFVPSQPHKLYTCSYDGQLRYADLQKCIFEKAIVDDESAAMSAFDFVDSDKTLVASCYDGQARLIDTRTGSEQTSFMAHNKAAKCISVNPRQKDYVATSCRDGGVHIFDLRKISHSSKIPKPLVDVSGHSRSVSSAYFSPISGNHLLTTSYDNHLRIFDTSVLAADKVKLKSDCLHNNQTGRWLSSFRACWHPSHDDIFIVGSMKRPRQIDIYDANAKMLQALCEPEILTSVCSVNSFHPSLDIVAGGNSSGRVFLFSN